MAGIRKAFGILLAGFCLLAEINAQQNRYMVFFSDKDDSGFSINEPGEFLSERAINRRSNQNIPITEQDFPVKSAYVNEIRNAGADVYYTSRWFNAALVQMDQSLLSTIGNISFVDSIHYIGKGPKLSRSKVDIQIPDTFLEPPATDLDTKFQLGMINADDMHGSGYKGEGIRIAVLDDGFQGVNENKPFEHLHTDNRIIVERDMVFNSGNPYQYDDHGTRVLSTIAGNHGDFVGSAYMSEFLLYVTEDIQSESPVEEYNWTIAAEHADSAGADIIHTSVGYSTFNDGFEDYTYEDLDGKTAIITRAAEIAFSKGMFVVTSAGNEGGNSWQYITAPADAENVLAVGSVTSEYGKSGFSSVGPTADGRIKPDVVALGSSTIVARGNGNIVTFNGTSFSAPIVSGLAAGIWQANPSWMNYELLAAIRGTASRALDPDTLFGYGIPNFNEAVIGRILSISDIVADKISVYPNPFRDNTVFIKITGNKDILPMTVIVYDTKGAILLDMEVPENSGDVVELDIQSDAKGIYFLKLHSKKFVKQIKLLKY